MKLIADSGSTKTSWVLIEKNTILKKWNSIGLNPNFIPKPKIRKNLLLEFKSELNEEIKEVLFYGSGAGKEENQKILHDEFKRIFPNAKIKINTDILAAALASKGHDRGMVGILGTGSVIAAYDGKSIKEIFDGLGYVMGDLAGGSAIGRSLLSAWLYDELPEDIGNELEEEFGLSKSKIIKQVYSNDNSTASYLAQFVPFVKKHENNPVIKELLENRFDLFFSKLVKQSFFNAEESISLVGSVAYYFEDIIKKVASKYQISIDKIIINPIDGLIEYHKED